MKLPLPDGRFVLSRNAFDELDGMSVEPPAVSVVIPYFEARADLDLVLAGLTAQTHPLTRLEVIVVDDGSSAPPSLPAGGPLDIRLASQERRGFRAAAARNLGAHLAQGDVLCFLDGDTVPEPAYVATAARLPALCPDALVVGRRLHADLTGWPAEDLRAGRFPPPLPAPGWLETGYADSRNLLDADARSFRFVLSAVMTCSTGLFREIRGFDESFISYGGEDWELAARAYQAGAVQAHEPAARAWHNGPDWAGRGGDLTAKNAESLLLSRLITAPGTRAHALAHEFPARVVTIDADGWSPAALLITVDAVLAGGDVGVWLVRGDAPGDSRVRVGVPPPEAVERAQQSVAITAPCVVDPSLLGQIGGRVTVTDEVGPLLSVTNTRAAGRVRRWEKLFPELDLFTELFGDDATGALARRIPDEPDLAGWFGGWAYQPGGSVTP